MGVMGRYCIKVCVVTLNMVSLDKITFQTVPIAYNLHSVDFAIDFACGMASA